MFNRWMGLGLMLVAGAAGTAQAIDTNRLPHIQALYGGQIRGLNIIQPAGTTNQVRLFLKTDFSANSIFYADLNYALADPFSTNNYSWRVVPDFNADAGFGTMQEIAAHQASERLFVACDSGILSCTIQAGSLVTNLPSSGGIMFDTVNIYSSVLLSIANLSNANSKGLYFGTLSVSGAFTSGAGSPITIPYVHGYSATAMQLEVNPVNYYVYIIDSYGTNGILKSSATYDALSAATTFSRIDISSVITNWVMGRRIGFGPDGRMFIGSKVSSMNTIAYSDNDGGSWTVVNTTVIGKGENFDTTGSTGQYNVVFGRAVSTNKGVAGSWFALGSADPPAQVRANDSSSKFDPINPQCIYFASDQGVGCTTNGGRNLREIDFGLEAVAIRGLDMNDAKTLGWTASASGLRRGVGAAGAVQWDVTGMFPMDDSAPYYSVALDKTDTSGNTVYAGNGYIYKTTDGGTNWTRVYAPFFGSSGSDVGLYISSIVAVSNEVFAGIYVWSGRYNSNLLYSANSGATWSNVSLEGTNGINVNKILATTENGVQLAYVGAEFNTNSSLGGHIYRVTQSGTTHVLLGSNNISIRDLAANAAGGVYASGWDQQYQPCVFYKPADTTNWTQLTTNGLPDMSFYSTGRGPVITIGRDASSNEVPIVGAGVTLYYLSPGALSWSTSTELHYPNGTQLSVLYWDALMVGTDCGLYGQDPFHGTAENTYASGDFDGDRLADPAVYAGTNWYIWMSANGYARSGPYPFGADGALGRVGDFDGDRYADPTVYTTNSQWVVWMSSAGYAPAGPFDFSFPGATPVPGDFDGDGLADPAVFLDGYWLIWMSGGGYAPQGPFTFGYAGTTPVPADYDGDQRADPAVFAGGYWLIWMSGSGYQPLGPLQFGIPNTLPVTGDFDGDGKADPAVVLSGSWYIWMSASGYQMAGPFIFTVE